MTETTDPTAVTATPGKPEPKARASKTVAAAAPGKVKTGKAVKAIAADPAVESPVKDLPIRKVKTTLKEKPVRKVETTLKEKPVSQKKTVQTDPPAMKSKIPIPVRKRASKSQRIHTRRMKQEAGRASIPRR
jgi:hypothetical protein